MTFNGWLQIALYCVVVVLLVKPLGGYITRVFAGERTLLAPLLEPVERLFCWLCGVDGKREQSWIGYALSMLTFSLVGFLLLYALMRLQALIPFFNPPGHPPADQGLPFKPPMRF